MIKQDELDKLKESSESNEADVSNETNGAMNGSMLEHRNVDEDDPLSVNGRLDLPVDKIGFDSSPPCKVGLRFFQARGRWCAYIIAPAGKLPMVEKWLQAYNPCSSQSAPGIAPRVVRVEFDALPDKLAYLFNVAQVQTIILYPQGVATVLFCDSLTMVQSVVQSVLPHGKDQDDVCVREPASLGRPGDVKITARQREALSLAVAFGYYEVPHRIGLRELAKKMDMSLGALSGLLRRAESAVLHSFADHFAKSEWRNLEQQLEHLHRSKNDAQTQNVPVS